VADRSLREVGKAGSKIPWREGKAGMRSRKRRANCTQGILIWFSRVSIGQEEAEGPFIAGKKKTDKKEITASRRGE